jgi:DHA1 family bicyclomycin/chloramphenicol resistance-like MFS transporter
MWLLVILTGCGTLPVHILVPAMPAAARELAVSNGTIQLAITLYLVGLAAGQLVYGTLSDRFGRRPVLLAGVALYVAMGALGALAPTIAVLLLARVGQSLGGCAGLVLGRAIIRDVAPPREAASRLAMVNLAMSVSPALAPLVGGYLTVWVSWRLTLVVLATIGTVGLLATLLLMPETHKDRGGGSGFAGLLRSYAQLARLPTFRAYSICGALGTTCFYAFMSASPFIFVDMLHRPTQEIGLYYAILFAGITLGSFVASRLVVRLGPHVLLPWSLAFATLGAASFLLAELGGWLSVTSVVGSLTVFTLGVGIVSPMALTLSIGTMPGAIGAASGLYGFMQMGFGAFCTFMMSLELANPALLASAFMTGSLLISLAAYMLGRRADQSASA